MLKLIKKSKLFVVSVLVLLFLSMFAVLVRIEPVHADTTYILQDNFETGSFSTSWTGDGLISSGETMVVSSASAVVKNGAYGANVTCNGDGTGEYISKYKTTGTRNDVWVSFWLKVANHFPNSNPAGDSRYYTPLRIRSSDGTTNLFEIRLVNNTGTMYWHIRYYNVTTASYKAAVSTPALALNTWFNVTCFFNCSATQGAIKLDIQGLEIISYSGFDTTNGKAGIGSVFIGAVYDYPSYPEWGSKHCLYFDDIAIYYITGAGGESTPPSGYFGYTSIGTTDNMEWATYIYFFGPYTSISNSITITELHLYTTASGQARVAVYSDLDSQPYELIVESGSQSVVADGWNTFNVADTTFWSIDSDSYWLAVQWGGNNMARGITHSYWTRFMSSSYGSFPSEVPMNLAQMGDEISFYANYTTSGYPWYGSVGVNSTKASRDAEFSIKWRDNGTIVNSTFSWNNGSSTWANTTSAFSGSPIWHNVTKTLNSTVSTVISYKWYGEDNQGHWTETDTYTLTTVALIEKPEFSAISVNASQPSASANFSVTIISDNTLDSAYLETNNTGTLMNGTKVSLSGYEFLASQVLTLNDTECTLKYRWHANSTSGWNSTDWQYLTISNSVNGSLYIDGNQIKLHSDDSVIIFKGINGGGYGDTVYGFMASSYNETYVENNLKALACWGMNNLRIMLVAKWWLENTTGYCWYVKRMIQIAETFDIYVVVSTYSVQAYPNSNHAALPFPPYLNAADSLIVTSEKDYINYLLSITNYLKNCPNFLLNFYDEPNGGTQNYQDWWRVAHEAALSIRQITTTPIVVQWGFCGDVNFAWDATVGLPWSDIENVMYEQHVFRDHSTSATFTNLEYLYADVKTRLELRGWYDAAFTHNLCMYMGSYGPQISGSSDYEEETAYNNTLSIMLNEWNISCVAYEWRDLQPYRQVVSLSTLYPFRSGLITMANFNIHPKTLSVGSSSTIFFLNDTSHTSSWNPTNKQLTINITGSGTAYVYVFWNVSGNLYPVNASLNVKFSNDTINDATDYYVSDLSMLKIPVSLSTETLIIGYDLLGVTLTIISPTNTTYTNSTIPIELSASGGTIDVIYYNITYSNGTIVVNNTVYSSETTETITINATYVFFAYANNTDGNADAENVTFTVAITEGSTPPPTPPPPSITTPSVTPTNVTGEEKPSGMDITYYALGSAVVLIVFVLIAVFRKKP